MMISRSELKKKDNFKIGEVWVKNITLNDLSLFEDNAFEKFAMIFCSKPFDFCDTLYEQDIDYATMTKYDLFNNMFYSFYQDDEPFRNFTNFIFFVKGSIVPYEINNKLVYFDSDTGIVLFSEENIEKYASLFQKMFGYVNRKEEKFANKMTKIAFIENIIENKELEKKENKGNNSSIYDVIDPIVLKTAYTYDTIWDITILQMNAILSKIMKEQEYKNVMTGVYTGNIDSKSLNLERYNWLYDKQ